MKKDTSKEEISIELVNSIASPELSSIARNIGEVALDAFLQEGVFRSIPVLNTIASVYKAGVDIRQRILMKKIAKFLQELSSIPVDKCEKFVEKIGDKRKFGEAWFLLIERAESLDKLPILGRLLKQHILGNISYEDVTRLSFIVDRVYICDLNYLLQFTSGIQSNPDIAASLQSVGLLSFAGIDGGTFIDGGELSSGGVIYELNDYGKMLLQYGLDTA